MQKFLIKTNHITLPSTTIISIPTTLLTNIFHPNSLINLKIIWQVKHHPLKIPTPTIDQIRLSMQNHQSRIASVIVVTTNLKNILLVIIHFQQKMSIQDLPIRNLLITRINKVNSNNNHHNLLHQTNIYRKLK